MLLCLAFGLVMIADVREWGSFSIGSGVFAILEYKRTPDATETAIGTGTVAISLLAGTLNAIAGTDTLGADARETIERPVKSVVRD